MEESNIISTYSKLIKEVIPVLQERINLLSSSTDNTLPDEVSALRVYQVRSLNIYIRYLMFISNELGKNDEEVAFFLIPQVRTLIDIYSKFLHLQINAREPKEGALISIAHQLLATHSAELKTEFNKTKLVYQKLTEGTPLSEINYEDYSFKWMQKNNYHFFSRDKLLTEDNVKRFAIDSIKIFKGQQLHKLYSIFSEFNHGNPFYGTNEPHNERYWVITMTVQITAYLIELIDRQILKKSQKADFRMWLQQLDNNKAELLLAWNQNSIKLEEKSNPTQKI